MLRMFSQLLTVQKHLKTFESRNIKLSGVIDWKTVRKSVVHTVTSKITFKNWKWSMKEAKDIFSKIGESSQASNTDRTLSESNGKVIKS